MRVTRYLHLPLAGVKQGLESLWPAAPLPVVVWRCMRTKWRICAPRMIPIPMGTTLELSDPLFARLKARAAPFRRPSWGSRGTWPARLGTDVHLAALTIAADWRLVSFDRDFGRFSALSWLPLAWE